MTETYNKILINLHFKLGWKGVKNYVLKLYIFNFKILLNYCDMFRRHCVIFKQCLIKIY